MEIDIFRKSRYHLLAVYQWVACWGEQNYYCIYVEKIPELGDDVNINNIAEHDKKFSEVIESYKSYNWVTIEAFIEKFRWVRVRCQKITLYDKHWDFAVEKKKVRFYRWKWLERDISYIQIPELTDSFTQDDVTAHFFCWIWDDEKKRNFCLYMKIPYIYEYNELDWEITTL